MCRVDLNVFACRSKQKWELKDVETKGCSSACLVMRLIYCPCLLCAQPFLSSCDDTQPVCNKGFPSRAGPKKKQELNTIKAALHLFLISSPRKPTGDSAESLSFPLRLTFTDFIFRPFSLIFRACWGLYHLLLAFLLVSLIVAIRVRLVAMRGKSQRRTQWRTGGKSSQEAACQGIYWMCCDQNEDWLCAGCCAGWKRVFILTQKYRQAFCLYISLAVLRWRVQSRGLAITLAQTKTTGRKVMKFYKKYKRCMMMKAN